MQVKFSFGAGQNGCVILKREATDPKFYGTGGAKGEHALFFYLKKWLNERGFDLIKKRAQRDGNLVGDQFQPYLRDRKGNFCIISGFYALRGAEENWNQGEVTLDFHGDENTFAFVQKLCKGRKEMSCVR